MISVCMATYNGEKFIKDQIDSILSQLEENDELIISDDISSDHTREMIASIPDKRIKLFLHKKKKEKYKFDYTTHNFENALRHAQGDYIFLADQDDIWLPEKVKLMSFYLQDYMLVLSDCKIVDAELKIISESYFQTNHSHKGVIKNIFHNSYLGCCMAFRKELLKYALPFPESAVAHDIWIGLMAEQRGKVFFLNVPLMLYRRHGENVSCSGEKSRNSLCFKIYYRVLILKNLIMRRRELR